MTDLCMKPLGGAYRLHFVKYFAHATAREVLLHIFKLLHLLVVNGRWKTKETFFFKNSKGLFSSNFGPKSSKFGPSTLMDILFHILLVAKLKSVKRLLLMLRMKKLVFIGVFCQYVLKLLFEQNLFEFLARRDIPENICHLIWGGRMDCTNSNDINNVII